MNPGRSDKPIAVSIVEDDEGVRESLSILIREAPGFRCLQAYPTAELALEGFEKDVPDVVLMDINLPQMSGIECTRHLKERVPSANIIMLTVYEDDDQIFEALQAGANGYLLKRSAPAILLDAISDVTRGGAPMTSTIARKVIQSFRQPERRPAETAALSPRESEVLELLAQGYLYKEIADQLRIGFETVHTHVRNIYDKLHVRSRTEAVAKYLRPKT